MNASKAMAALVGLGALSASACGDEAPTALVQERWRYTAPAKVAPPGLGADERVLVGLELAKPSGGGELVTLEERGPRAIEGPYGDVPLTARAPRMIGSDLFVVSTIGNLTKLNLAGEIAFSQSLVGQPTLTTPIASAPDGSLRIATNTGKLLGLSTSDGSEIFSADFGQVPTSALAVDAAGRTFVATDVGNVLGYDASGTQVFSVSVAAPASGPSVASNGDVIVGDANSVRAFDASGNPLWTVARDARVLGTKAIDGGDYLAWGEDGVLQRIGADGEVKMQFSTGGSNPAPISVEPFVLEGGAFAVIDDRGVAHLVGEDGTAASMTELGGRPAAGSVRGSLGLVYVGIEAEIVAVAFSE